MSARPWLLRVAKWALFVLVAVVLMPQPAYRGAPATLLNPAQFAVDLAAQSGQVDPAATVFGLGPLSRLATRAPGIGQGWLLAFDLLVAAAVVYGLYLLFRRANSAEALLGILASALLVEGVRAYVFPLAVLLWLVLLVVLLDYVQRETILSLLAAAGLSWLLFYFQSSVGLAALAMLAATLVFRLACPGRRGRRFTALALAAWLALGPLLALLLRIDLAGHVANALRLRSLAAATAPALAIGKASGSEFLWLALTILLIFAGVLLANRRALRGQAADWLASVLVGALLLLAFREAFVRPWGHPWLFFQAAAAGIGILALMVTSGEAARRFGGAFAAALILSFPVVSANFQADYLSARTTSLRCYAAWALNREQPSTTDPRLEAYVLPPRLLEIIGESTVDATAEMLPFVVANDLAYQPSAAIPSLAEMAGQIGSDNRPRFIMLGLGDDPAHNPFPAGSPAALDLLQDYRVVWRFGDAFLLLERLPQSRPLQQTGTSSGGGQLGEAVALDAPGAPGAIKRLQAEAALSLPGRLAQAVALTPQLDLTVEYVDGGRKTLRLSADQLRAGVQLGPVVDDLATAELFSAASGLLNRPVTRFWLQAAPSWAFGAHYAYTVDSFGDLNAAASDDWQRVTLDDGQQLRLAAVQVSPEADAVVGDVFWEVDPATIAPDMALEHSAFARLLDETGNAVASTEIELRDRAPGLRTLASGPRRFLAARLRLPLPPDAATAVYDLEVGLTPAGQPPESAVWRTKLPAFVQLAPQE